MNPVVRAFAPVLLVLLSACGKGATPDPTQNMAGIDAGPANAAADAMLTGVPGSPAQAFADAISGIDLFAIQSAEVARERASAEPLRTFAADMLEAHARSTDQLNRAGAEAEPAVVANPLLSVEQEANLASLRAAQGAAFDAAYRAQQIAAHQQALTLLQGYAATGDVDELKAYAVKAQKTVQDQLQRIKTL